LNVPLVVAASNAQSLPREGDRTSRRLSAEEKEQRRLRRNIITATVGVVLLLILMTVLMKIAG
jgi:predicted nucleic acid-binding Zn ribbon protein